MYFYFLITVFAIIIGNGLLLPHFTKVFTKLRDNVGGMEIQGSENAVLYLNDRTVMLGSLSGALLRSSLFLSRDIISCTVIGLHGSRV